MAERVFLHVGSPKTGTTFLQEILWSQRERALEQGLLLPLSSFYDHFLATADVREMSGEERFPARATGIWRTVVEEGRSWKGDVLLSHELFAGATQEQARRAVRAWGDADVHVIVTARDLGRQIPAEWQEHLKHRSGLTFAEFVEALRTNGPAAAWFWTVQDYAAVCKRWGTELRPSRVHVVTVPAPGASPDLLWKRFAGLVGLDAASFDLVATRSNTSLRAEQAELLRRVNLGLQGQLMRSGPYSATVKEVFAQEVLAGRPGRPVVLAGDDMAFAVKRSADLVAELTRLRVDIVGDLSELVPELPTEDDGASRETIRPETVAEPVLLEESLVALRGLLDHYSTLRTQVSETQSERHALEAEVTEARAELARVLAHNDLIAHDMRYRPLHLIIIGQSERRPWLMRLRVRYWHAVEAVRRLTRRQRTD